LALTLGKKELHFPILRDGNKVLLKSLFGISFLIISGNSKDVFGWKQLPVEAANLLRTVFTIRDNAL
jgi:hypothetical protein